MDCTKAVSVYHSYFFSPMLLPKNASKGILFPTAKLGRGLMIYVASKTHSPPSPPPPPLLTGKLFWNLRARGALIMSLSFLCTTRIELVLYSYMIRINLSLYGKHRTSVNIRATHGVDIIEKNENKRVNKKG